MYKLSNDVLYKLLKSGKASKDDQRQAAFWIKRLYNENNDKSKKLNNICIAVLKTR